MAPTATDPRQLIVVLNPARRKAFFKLATDICSRIRAQLVLREEAEIDATDEEAWSDDDTLCGEDDGSGSSAGNATTRKKKKKKQPEPPSRKLIQTRAAALAHYDEWRNGLLERLREIVTRNDDARVLEERKRRAEALVDKKPETPYNGADLISFGSDGGGAGGVGAGQDPSTLRRFYPPVETRLTTVSFADRLELLSSMLLLLLSTGNYSAYSRVYALHLASSLELPLTALADEEKEIAQTLMQASAEAEKGGEMCMSADAEAEKRRKEGQKSRFWKVGLASVAGAAVIGITGGLAAPVVAGAIGGLMGTVGLGGVASFLGIFWMNGALVGTLFGAMGAKMTGEMMDNYAKEVEDFRFLPVNDANPTTGASSRRLRVTIGVNGWLTTHDDVTGPWRGLSDESEVFALRYEMDSLLALGTALESLVSTYAWRAVKLEILKRTVLASIWAALWPAYIISIAAKIDNPFNLAKNRSEKAGRVLADALINRVQGERPVTLVGYSLGARLIYSCLRSLAEREAFGLVDEVILIGAPAPSDQARWELLRPVVVGRIFNIYSNNDYILGFLYRSHSLQFGIAGLQPIEHVKGLENMDLSEQVSGHLRYPDLTSQILARCGFPNVRGGDFPIEREDDLEAAEVDTGSQVGELVELGILEAEALPHEPKTLASERPRYADDLWLLSTEGAPPKEVVSPVAKQTNQERRTVSRSGKTVAEVNPLEALVSVEDMSDLVVDDKGFDAKGKGKAATGGLLRDLSSPPRPRAEPRSQSAPGAVEPKSLAHPGLAFVHPVPVEYGSQSTGDLPSNLWGLDGNEGMYEDEDSGGISMVDNEISQI
jgi:hypothetical protein